MFLRALRALPEFGHAGVSFRAWLFRTARAVLADAPRGRPKNQGARAGSGLPGETAVAPCVRGDELAGPAAVGRALARLPETQRQIVALTVVAGLSAADAAAVLGHTAETVQAGQHAALWSLRQLLGESTGA